ncbi:ABC transporter permease [Rugosimonospora africana]|uniref:Sugar ABC transporter permease n=1 Tax=Rugosimonospora africana TaxID=556532 RepID=A0A8J3VWR0_9ACTN|nr:ABC transporter permease [Rugosimonospora africana]GIH21058.1 sugar ABC transporter permease [Rugosimonospora africana]
MSTIVEEPVRTRPPAGRFTIRRLRDFSLIPVILLLLIVGFIVSPNFLTKDNMLAVLQQCTELSLLVLGEALILIAGRMDLSLESTIGVAPVLAVWLVLPAHGGRFNGLGTGLPGWTAIPLCLLIGAIIGAINGLVILKVRINAFILTLGMLIALRGLQVGVSGGNSIFELPSSFTYLGRTSWLGVPASVWICAALFAIAIVLLSWHRHGRALYAIGGNADASRAAGIRTDRLLLIVFITASTLAALAGILYVGHYGSISASQGDGWIFQVFAATVIGGVSLNGGRGSMFGALTGVVALQLILNVMNFAHVPPVWDQLLDGVIILAALIVSRFSSGEAQD